MWRAGPLEATIRNLQRELQKKEAEGKELQRHWIVLQTELVARQNENGRLTESQARLTSNFSILYQKKVALEHELAREQAQARPGSHASCSLLRGPGGHETASK